MARYLDNLNQRLADGAAALPAALREKHAAYLVRKQNADGGFSGRDGDSDLYYTGFALRGLALLDALDSKVAERATTFLKTCLTRQTSVVDFFSFLYACVVLQASGGHDVLADSPSDWPQRVAEMLETFRTPDGGYNKSPGAKSASTYHTFLVGLCFELLGRSFPRPEEVLALVRSRRRDDGGFVEIAAMRRSGTNPTAAGVGILQLVLGSKLSKDDIEPIVEFLAQMPSFEGGLRANDKVPLADLLSTFTGLWSLAELGALDRVPSLPAHRFAESLQEPDGGFKGGAWDEATDVEYTFYGLGTLALTR
jgi:geranylgeranyl transferase type-2 subunit beta